MAKLVLSVEGVILREFPLEGETYSIGRKPQADIQIDDITISGKHALVSVAKNFYIETLQDVYVEDLGSTNGTLVNGQRIKKHMLRHGDVVQIGRHEFKFIDESAPDFDKTVIIKPEAEKIKARPVLPALVKVLTGPKMGETLDLTKSFTSLGNAGATVVISKRAHGYFIVHIQGKSATKGETFPLLNGNPIGAQSVPLTDRDIIEISGMKLEFVVKV